MTGSRIAYIGGGSTRAPGTVAAFLERATFSGSELVLMDLAEEHVELVARLGRKLAAARGADVRISATTDLDEALADADIVLTSFRPGGFEARALDERIPLRFGVIGQETQGPGGLFLALRTLPAFKKLVEEMERRCPRALLVNYSNPVNIVAQAVTEHSDIRTVSLCEGPIMWPRLVAAAAGLDPDEVEATMAGLNHACWSVEVAYPGEEDFFDLVEAAWAGRPADANGDGTLQLLQLAATMRSIPADYLRYFYFGPTILAEQQTARRSRAEQLIEESPGYWEHYREEAEKADPRIDPARARAGVGELELAVEVIEAAVGDRRSTFTVNMPNRGAIAGFDDDLVVEIPAVCSGSGFVSTIEAARLPTHVLGLIEMLAEYQRLAAHAGWSGDRRDGVRALAAHPFVLSLPAAEALYAAMASAQAQWLPDRLL